MRIARKFKKMYVDGGVIDTNPPKKSTTTNVPAKQFMADYMSSSMYKSRLANFNAPSPSVQNLLNIPITANPKQSTEYYNDSKTGRTYVNINTTEDTGIRDKPANIMAHELSHGARELTPQEQSYILNMNKSPLGYGLNAQFTTDSALGKYKGSADGYKGQSDNGQDAYHDYRPNENKADLDALRFMMFSKGIYDTSKRNMTLDDFNKASQDPEIKNSMMFNRLKQQFTPDDIIQMNNKVATNTPQETLPVAAYGGTMRIPTGKRFKKAYNYGGTVDPNDPTQRVASSTTPGAAGIASAAGSLANFIPTTPSPDGHVKGGAVAAKDGLKYGAEGAEIGSVIPGVGTVIGGAVGVVGGVTAGLISAGAQNRKADAYDRYNRYTTQLNSQQRGDAMYGSNPSARFGDTAGSNFAEGGTLPNSGPTPKKGLPVYDPTKAPTYNPALLTNGKFLVSKPDGSLGQWGKDLPPVVPPPPPVPPPVTPLSDKALGYSSTYYSPVQQNQSKAIPEIQPSSNYVRSFADGGSIHIKPSHEGRFTAYKKATGKTTEEALHSKDAHVRKMANFAKNAAGWKKAFGGQLDDNLPPTQQVPGGSLTPINSTTTQVNGDSHAQGGVQLPQAEVEGGETISNGFVFSKELGFADLHKPIARAIGKIEAKPMNPVRRQTLGILKNREATLAAQQELMKHSMGIPSDLTGGR